MVQYFLNIDIRYIFIDKAFFLFTHEAKNSIITDRYSLIIGSNSVEYWHMGRPLKWKSSICCHYTMCVSIYCSVLGTKIVSNCYRMVKKGGIPHLSLSMAISIQITHKLYNVHHSKVHVGHSLSVF